MDVEIEGSAPDLPDVLSRLERGLRSNARSLESPRWLRPVLEALETALRRSYAAEGQADLAMRDPARARRLDRLREEHVLLVDWAHRLVAVSHFEPDPVLVATLLGETRELVDRVRRHAREKRRLLLGAVETDLGL